MQIMITRTGTRARMRCVRDDGSDTAAELGPGLPYHDLAHVVAERHFGLRQGFFGSIMLGRTISELADEDVIRNLGPEAWQAEVLARAVGSLVTGACRPDQFEELVKTELDGMEIAFEADLSESVAVRLRDELAGLIREFDAIPDGGVQTMWFESDDAAHAR